MPDRQSKLFNIIINTYNGQLILIQSTYLDIGEEDRGKSWLFGLSEDSKSQQDTLLPPDDPESPSFFFICFIIFRSFILGPTLSTRDPSAVSERQANASPSTSSSSSITKYKENNLINTFVVNNRRMHSQTDEINDYKHTMKTQTAKLIQVIKYRINNN